MSRFSSIWPFDKLRVTFDKLPSASSGIPFDKLRVAFKSFIYPVYLVFLAFLACLVYLVDKSARRAR